MEHDRLEAFMTLVTGASRSITKIKTKYMSNYGLGSTHTACMRKLFDCPDGVTRTQLAESCDLDKAQVTRIINELAEKGYAIESGAKSQYKRRVMLTETGRKVTTEINDIVLNFNEYVSEKISCDELETFYKVFGIICTNLKSAEEFSEPPITRKD